MLSRTSTANLHAHGIDFVKDKDDRRMAPVCLTWLSFVALLAAEVADAACSLQWGRQGQGGVGETVLSGRAATRDDRRYSSVEALEASNDDDDDVEVIDDDASALFGAEEEEEDDDEAEGYEGAPEGASTEGGRLRSAYMPPKGAPEGNLSRLVTLTSTAWPWFMSKEIEVPDPQGQCVRKYLRMYVCVKFCVRTTNCKMKSHCGQSVRCNDCIWLFQYLWIERNPQQDKRSALVRSESIVSAHWLRTT